MSPTRPAWWARHGFLISLTIVFAVGFFGSSLLRPITSQVWLREMIVFAVMWSAGITLPLKSMRRAIVRPGAVAVAVLINVLLVPLLCLPIAAILAPLWISGLVVAMLVPCTLASAAVWTRRAGGDDSIALVTTVVTNLACLFVIPVGIASVFGLLSLDWFSDITSLQGASTVTVPRISASEQISKLAILVVAPLSLAQGMRWAGWSDWADQKKLRLAKFAQIGILAMVLCGAVASAEKLDEKMDLGNRGLASSIGWTNVVLSGAGLVAATSSIHLIALVAGIAITRWGLRLGQESQIAVGIAGSQKTLMIGLQIAIDLGVSVVPMIVYHLAQLVWDTLIADAWAKRYTDPPVSDK